MKSSRKGKAASVRSSEAGERDRVMVLATFLAPTLLALGWGFMMPGSGPQLASAGPDLTMPAGEASTRIRKATDAEIEATEYCMSLCAEASTVESPSMLPAWADDDEDEDIPVQITETNSKPDVQVGSILRDAQGQPAVYADGRLFSQGDELIDGWIIETIDLPRRTVTVRHPDIEEPIVLMPGR